MAGWPKRRSLRMVSSPEPSRRKRDIGAAVKERRPNVRLICSVNEQSHASRAQPGSHNLKGHRYDKLIPLDRHFPM